MRFYTSVFKCNFAIIKTIISFTHNQLVLLFLPLLPLPTGVFLSGNIIYLLEHIFLGNVLFHLNNFSMSMNRKGNPEKKWISHYIFAKNGF